MSFNRQLPNAPLVFVLAGLRFESLEALPTWVPIIQEELRRWFPSFKRFRQTASAGGMEVAVDPQDFDPDYIGSSWVFATTDQSTIVGLFKSGLVVHTTDYTVFSSFANHITKVMEALMRAAGDVINFNSVGIRYVDHIRSQRGMHVERLIASSLMPAEVSSQLVVQNSSSFASYVEQGSGTTLNVRFNIGEGGLVIPQDLLPPYMLNTMPKNAQEGMFPFPLLRSGEGSLDLDAINAGLNGKILSVQEVVKEIDRLHRVANDYFYSVTTPEARSAWGSAIPVT